MFRPSPAFAFVLTMGVVNLFGDVTYEGGGSINGPFMAALGASAAVVSITAGLGEFLGYALRLFSGYVADRSGRYWTVTFIGYAINLFAVPAMALAGNWQVAAGLILAERIGRAVRKPTVEAMLSYTTAKHGRGWVYGVNTALDETGATLGPLIIALVLFLGGNYRTGYALLAMSASLALVSLAFARIRFPMPSRLEEGTTAPASSFTSGFWLYTIAGALFAAGLLSFELVSFHLAETRTIAPPWIPVLLAFSTGCGVIANLVLGRLYDRLGLRVVLGAVVVSSLFAPLLFAGGLAGLLLAMVVWGIGYSTQDTLLKAIVAGVLPKGKRSLAFGLFYAGYGVGWLLGSAAMGLLYELSHAALAAFAVVVQLASLPLFLAGKKRSR